MIIKIMLHCTKSTASFKDSRGKSLAKDRLLKASYVLAHTWRYSDE